LKLASTNDYGRVEAGVDAEKARFVLLESIFHEALSAPAAQRSALLESRCEGNATLAADVASLLAASDAEESIGARLAADSHGAKSELRSLGPYQLDRLLGRGGMGAVYLAHRVDGQFDQQVAIKLIDLPLATDLFRERFRLERQILAGLVHSHIARLLDGGVSEGGELYLAMEYVDGVPITHYAKERALTLRQRLELFTKVCGAVQFAHRNLVVHRDLKPDNILVVADGTPRLLDFGTAKLVGPADAATGFTQHGLQSYTPQYASPEQVLGGPISTATDTYSLGVLLFALLTGVPPYTMSEFTTAEMLRVICTEQPPRPGSMTPAAECADFRIDADLDAIVLKALRKEPVERYLTVDQFSADIEAWLNGRPVAARRGDWNYRAGKFARRNRIPLVAAGLLTATLIAGIAGVLWQSRIADLQRKRAEARAQDLRELSNSLLSEIDEAIKDLPGSTPVQQLLVARVLEHLDRMGRDSIADELTQKDLVGAYTRLGNLQGNPYDQNIGDPTGAGVSLDKAIRLATSLKESSPKNLDILKSLGFAQQSRGEVLFGAGRTKEAISSMRAAVASYDTALRLTGASPNDFAAAATAVGGLGDFLGQAGTGSLGDQIGALQSYRRAMQLSERALALDSTFMRSRRSVATMHLKTGNMLLNTDPVEALKEFRLSLAAWQAMPDAEQSAAATRRGIAYAQEKIGMALAAISDYPRSISAFEQARPTFQYYADADADDSRANYDLAVLYTQEALVHVEALNADPKPPSLEPRANAHHAAELLEKSIAILQGQFARNSASKSLAVNIDYEHAVLGTLEQTYKLSNDGVQLAAAGMAALVQSAQAADVSVDVLELATSTRLTILPAHLRDAHWTMQFSERLVDATHRKNPRYLLTLARALLADGRGAASAAAAAEGLALLPSAAANAPVPRLAQQLRLLATATATNPTPTGAAK
jgi:eukaryotic-like serine/threonine-protein kinase